MHQLVERIRRPRWTMTDAERLLWSRLRDRQLGVAFHCHVPLGPYIVDFLCDERRLVVELVGSGAAPREEDRERDAWLAAAGFRVRRFPEHEVLLRPDAVVAALWLAVEGAAAAPPLASSRQRSRGGRGRQPSRPPSPQPGQLRCA